MKKLITIITVIISGNLLAQDIHFSQFYMSPLTQNPALAGANYDMQANLNYKDQWRNVNAPFRTFAGSFDMRTMSSDSKGGFLAAGINFANDRAGSSRMGFTTANLNVAYHVRLDDKNTLGLGMESGIIQRGADINNVSWGSQYDGSAYNSSLASGETAPTGNFTKFDMGAGFVWSYNKGNGQKNSAGNRPLSINVGVSAFHLTQPDYSFLGSDETLYMKYVAHGNATVGVSDRWSILPGFLFYRQGPAQEIYVGSLAKVALSRSTEYMERSEGAAIAFGGYFRANDAFSAHLLVDYAAFTFGMSYDINVSDLKIASNGRGGLELSISFVTDVFKAKNGTNSRI
jgi:type IX secretion system PorP/SprF family membrane protein